MDLSTYIYDTCYGFVIVIFSYILLYSTKGGDTSKDHNNNSFYLQRIYMLSIVAYMSHGPHKRLVYCTML